MSPCCQFGGVIVCTDIDWPGPREGEVEQSDRIELMLMELQRDMRELLRRTTEEAVGAKKVSKAAPKKPSKLVGKKVKK